MLEIRSVDILRELLSLESTDQLESWLSRTFHAAILTDDSYWRLVGDQRSNAGSIEQSADEINPIAERIVNGIEAVLELRVAETGMEPGSPRHAIESLFGAPQGRARLLNDTDARRLAGEVVVTLRGPDRSVDPTIQVRDFGLGIHPTEFPNTVLALGQSDKGQKTYLVGMYGQGGSSTFDKCEYTIIVSRLHPHHLPTDIPDRIGWTVVRRSLDVRARVYKYLVDSSTRSAPHFSGALGDAGSFQNGTLIAHIGYKTLGGFSSQQITNNAFYTLNYRLFDPLIPWTLADHRGGNRTSRTMRGIPYRVSELPGVAGIGSLEARSRQDATAVRLHTEYRHELPSGSSLRVEWWILQDEQVLEGRRRREHYNRLRPYRDQTRRYSRRAIAITRGGQTHAALSPHAIFRKKRLRQIARSIVVQVDTDDMTFEEGAGFFASNRADLKTISQDQVEEAINAAIDLHIDKLRAIERERQQELVAGRAASDEDAIRQHLDPMIRAFQRSREIPGASPSPSNRRASEFRGLQVPTFLRFARNRPLPVYPGIPTRIELLTDATDDVVRSHRTDFRIESTHQGLQIGQFQGGNSRWRVSLFPSPDIAVGTSIQITAAISQPNSWRLTTPTPCQITIAEPPPPYEGNNPPTFIRFRAHNGQVRVRQGGSRIAIESDARDDVLLNGAVLTVVSPDPNQLPIAGLSSPREGDFRVNLRVPETASLGPAGEIIASLRLSNGHELDDIATLIIDEKLSESGATDIRSQANYEIQDVVEVPVAQGVLSWSDMPRILDASAEWSGADVGSHLESESEADRKITFYLNVDNRELRQIERWIASRRSEAAVDAFREMHRTLICFHLYRLAIREVSEAEDNYSAYRSEMIRVGQTLLYTQREFLEQLAVETSDE